MLDDWRQRSEARACYEAFLKPHPGENSWAHKQRLRFMHNKFGTQPPATEDEALQRQVTAPHALPTHRPLTRSRTRRR